MKNLFFILMAFGIFLLACNNDDDPVTTITPTDVNNTLASGT